jgi:hypothetical protein
VDTYLDNMIVRVLGYVVSGRAEALAGNPASAPAA